MKEEKKNNPEIKDNLTEKSKFVIYCVARTGSYHLASLLDSATDIVCHGEIFKQHRVELRGVYKNKISSITKKGRDSHPWAFIRSIRELDSELHFGFKLFQQHVGRVGRLRGILRSARWKKIALLRDPIEVYASLLRAQKTLQWTKPKGRAEPSTNEDVVVHYNQQSFKQFAKNYGSYLKYVLSFHGRPDWLLVPYERLNDPEMQQIILDFLGSRALPSELSSNYEKQHKHHVSEAFDNWEEITEYLERNNPFGELRWGNERAGSHSGS